MFVLWELIWNGFAFVGKARYRACIHSAYLFIFQSLLRASWNMNLTGSGMDSFPAWQEPDVAPFVKQSSNKVRKWDSKCGCYFHVAEMVRKKRVQWGAHKKLRIHQDQVKTGGENFCVKMAKANFNILANFLWNLCVCADGQTHWHMITWSITAPTLLFVWRSLLMLHSK